MQNKYHSPSHISYEALTPDTLSMLQIISTTGSFAAAARRLDLVPSTLTYRVRQLEEALDVLLFDRSSRQAIPTDAGRELLREGLRLLEDMDAIASRIKRIATGWEAQLTIAVDTIIAPSAIMELCQTFLETNPPTRIRIRDEALSGTIQTLESGLAKISINTRSGPLVLFLSSPRITRSPSSMNLSVPKRSRGTASSLLRTRSRAGRVSRLV
jgi:DNA-binding transcriptional LysR family regulator